MILNIPSTPELRFLKIQLSVVANLSCDWLKLATTATGESLSATEERKWMAEWKQRRRRRLRRTDRDSAETKCDSELTMEARGTGRSKWNPASI